MAKQKRGEGVSGAGGDEGEAPAGGAERGVVVTGLANSAPNFIVWRPAILVMEPVYWSPRMGD